MNQINMDQTETAAAALSSKPVSRRGLGAVSAAFLAGLGPVGALLVGAKPAQAQTVTDQDILNFALNLEYLEAEFYLRAVTGQGLPANLVGGTATGSNSPGGSVVNGGAVTPFTGTFVNQLAVNLALDEQGHVQFLRNALGSAAIARPVIDLAGGFQAAALAAGAVAAGSTFNPFANQTNFLLGAYILEDVGVTAYSGAAASIQDKSILAYAASILTVEAYHGGTIRAALIEAGGNTPQLTQAISNLRSQLSGTVDDAGIIDPVTGLSGIAVTDSNGLSYQRTPSQVINIVTANGHGAGGFFPNGLNGTITS